MYNKNSCKQTYFRIPECFWEAFHLSWIHQPHRRIPDHHGVVTLPQLPGSLHWFQSCAASCQLPAEPMDHGWAEMGLGDGTGRDGQGTRCLTLNSPGALERCFTSEAVPKSKASLPAASQQRCPQPRQSQPPPRERGQRAADREEPTAQPALAPGSSCYSSSSWWSFKPLPIHLSLSKLKQQLLAVDGEPKARRTTQTKAVKSVTSRKDKGIFGISTVSYESLQQEGWGEGAGQWTRSLSIRWTALYHLWNKPSNHHNLLLTLLWTGTNTKYSNSTYPRKHILLNFMVVTSF